MFRWTFNTIRQHIVWWENCITKTHKHILEFSLLHAYFIPSKNKIQWHNLIKLAKIVQICLFNVTVNTRLFPTQTRLERIQCCKPPARTVFIYNLSSLHTTTRGYTACTWLSCDGTVITFLHSSWEPGRTRYNLLVGPLDQEGAWSYLSPTPLL